MNSYEKVIELLLKECKEIFCEEKDDYKRNKYIKCKNLLEYAIITHYKSNDKIKNKLSDPIKVWKMNEEKIEEADLNTKAVNDKYSGRYFKVAEFSFYIDLENKKGIFNFLLGPRYGRGYSFDIEMSNNKYILKNPKILWVS